MVTIADNVTAQAIAPKIIPASAPLLIPEPEETTITVATMSTMLITIRKFANMIFHTYTGHIMQKLIN